MKAPETIAPEIDSLVAEVADRFTEEVKQGLAPSIEDYAHDHPEIATIIRQVFPALAVLGDIEAGAMSAVRGSPDDSVVRGSPDPAHPASAIGLLGDFRILREIGRGGMGVVYEAEQISLGRRVALKVLPFAAMLDRQQLARFKNEARAAATLDHPNIVAIYSVGVERGVHYYAMQLIEGQSLAQVIDQLRQVGAASRAACSENLDVSHLSPARLAGLADVSHSSPARLAGPTADTAPVARLSTLHAPSSQLPAFSTRDYFRTVAQLGIQAAEALDHAHQNGILHRDIKPANLLVECFTTPRPVPVRDRERDYEAPSSYTPKLWITDFGLARIEQDAGLTMTGDVLGTLRYMSPEQALGSRAVVDHRSDIYSLGVTLYELLTGQPAYEGNDRQEILRKIGVEEPRPPRKINHRIPIDLETIVLKAIRKSPDQRYSTAQDLASDLQSFVDSKPIRARPPTWLDHVMKWARRHQAALLASIAVLALVTFGLTIGTLVIFREKNAAVAARLEATEHFQLARDAVDQLMTRVAQEELLNAPQMEQFRKSLLIDALEFYQKLLKRDANNESLRYAGALAQLRVGGLLRLLGRRVDAVEACEAAVSQLRQLVSDYPERPKYKLALARALCRNSDSLQLLDLSFDASGSEAQSAQHRFREAIQLVEGIYRQSPANSEFALALAETYCSSVVNRRSSIPETVDRLTRARSVLEPCALGGRATIAQKDRYAEIMSNLGAALTYAGRADEGRQVYEDALRYVRELLLIDASDRKRRQLLEMTLQNFANQFPPSTDDELLAIRKECVNLCEGLVRDFPSMPLYRQWWAGSLINLGVAYKKVDDLDSAIQQYAQATKISNELCHEYPSHRDYFDLLCTAHSALLKTQRRSRPDGNWLQYAQDFRQLLLLRARSFNDNKPLHEASKVEWWTARELISSGEFEDGIAWAADACQHLRTFLEERNGQPNLSDPGLFEFPRTYLVELHRAGFAEQSDQFTQDLSEVAALFADPIVRGEFFAAVLGQYAEAAEEYEAAVFQNSDDSGVAVRAALLLLMLDDRTGYEAVCGKMLNRFKNTQDADATRRTCWACLMSSHPVGDTQQLLQLAKRAVETQRSSPIAYRERGLADYRMGDWEGALKWCAESRQLTKQVDNHQQGYTAQNLLIEAMALHGLRQTREARAAFDEAIKLTNEAFPDAQIADVGVGTNWIDWVYIELLRREAESLLKIPAKPDQPLAPENRDSATKIGQRTTDH